MKDKQISEEELLEELDTMYQRVADIEKEEAAEPPAFVKTKPNPRKKKTFRTIIIAAFIFFIALSSILAITVFDPVTLLQRLITGDTQPSTVVTPRSPSKRPAVAHSPATPKPPAAVVTSPEPQKPQAVAASSAAPPPPPVATPPATTAPTSVTPSPAPPKPASQVPPFQAKKEAVKRTEGEPEKATSKPQEASSKPQEIVKPNKPVPRGRYYAIQVGAFGNMENVREVVEAFKKEGVEAYWITVKSKGSGSLHRVLVGQFTDENEAAQFLADKKIFKNYPDSFIKAVPSSKMNR
ncbi:MAG: SPOR domain-containing protein [bacterium]